MNQGAQDRQLPMITHGQPQDRHGVWGGILTVLSSFIRTVTVGSGLSPDLLTSLQLSSFIRTVTVGSGLSPDLLTSLQLERSARGLPGATRDTAGGDLHPALRIS